MSRKPMECKLGGFGQVGSRRHLAPEVTSKTSYLPSAYHTDIWSIGVTILQFSLFSPWRMSLSLWSEGQYTDDQLPRPTVDWHTLTQFANTMLEFDPKNRLSATSCLEKLSRENFTKALSKAEQRLNNFDFLRRQKSVSFPHI